VDAPPRLTADPTRPGFGLRVVVGLALTEVRIVDSLTGVRAQAATNLRTDQYWMCPAAGRSTLVGSVGSA
jgi:hypothetical protein